MIERLAHHRGVAAKRRENVGLDRRVIGSGHIILAAGRDDHRGDGPQIVALRRSESVIG